MEKFTSVESVIKRAIELEEEAYSLYSNAAAASKNEAIRDRLLELAKQETGA